MTTRSLVRTLASAAGLASLLCAFAFSQAVQPGYPNTQAGRVLASAYANWSVKSLNAVSAASNAMTLNQCTPQVGSNGRFAPFGSIFALNVPLLIVDGASTETVTPTAVSSPTPAGPSAVNPINCSFTATFTNAHSAGVTIMSGDNGLFEAVNDAVAQGFGLVTVDGSSGLTVANIESQTFKYAPGYIQLEYMKSDGSIAARFTVQPSNSTAISAPTTATTSATCSSSVTVCVLATTGGTWANATYHPGFVYVDYLGGMSAASADATLAAGSSGTGVFQFTSPTATAGAAGWLPWAGTSLAAGYVLPVTSTVCTLSTYTPYPTCAIGSNATVLGPSTTGPIRPVAGGLANVYNMNPLSHTAFQFSPGRGSVPGIQENYGPFTVTPALTAGQLGVVGTVPLPVGFLNTIGRTLHLSFDVTNTPSTGGTAQGVDVEIGNVTDFTTGTPKIECIGNGDITASGTAAIVFHEECDLTTTATGTTGTIQPGGFGIEQVAALGTIGNPFAIPSTAVTTDVADWDILYFVYLQTSGAETTTPPQLQSLRIQAY